MSIIDNIQKHFHFIPVSIIKNWQSKYGYRVANWVDDKFSVTSVPKEKLFSHYSDPTCVEHKIFTTHEKALFTIDDIIGKVVNKVKQEKPIELIDLARLVSLPFITGLRIENNFLLEQADFYSQIFMEF